MEDKIFDNERKNDVQSCTLTVYFLQFQRYFIPQAEFTHKSKLVSLYRQQKHAARIIYFKDKLTHAEPLLKKMNALNVYQLNIFQTLNFMFKTKHQLVPLAFQNIFSTKINKYTLKSSNLTIEIPFKKSKLTQFSISYRGTHLWNTVLRNKTKLIQ